MHYFPTKTPAEVRNATFSFGDAIPDGTTISAPVLGKSLLKGTDPACAALVLSDMQQQGTDVVFTISGGAQWATYELSCTVTCSDGEIFQVAAGLEIRPLT